MASCLNIFILYVTGNTKNNRHLLMKVVILCSQNFWFIVQENIFLQLLLQFLPAEECIVKIHAATL
jgi:hypothetical protein